jgi:hypothetical protein
MATQTPRYAIDTCSLTTLRRVYPKDVFPGVWTKVSELADNGVLISVEDVYEELKVFDDDVLEWAKEHSDVFVSLDEEIQLTATDILETHTNLLDITYFSQLQLANVHTAFMRSEPRRGAALASIVPSGTPRDGALSN